MKTTFPHKIARPVPLPTSDVRKARKWLAKNLPLGLCKEWAEQVTRISCHCGKDIPAWLRKLARRLAATPPRPKDVQLTAYVALVQYPLHQCYERIFDMPLEAADSLAKSPQPRFEKYMSQHYHWVLEVLAGQTPEFQRDPAAARAAISRVWFTVSCEPPLF